MVVEIVRLNHTGDGVGYLDGKVIFVSKTIPGDVILVKNIQDKRSYYLGEVEKYLERGSFFEKAVCPYYQECGGCQIMDLPYLEQLNSKKSKVIDIFKKYTSLKIEPEIVGSSQQFYYRNKITLQVENGNIGLYHPKTRKLVPIKSCFLVKKGINEVIQILSSLNLSEVFQIVIKEFQQKIMVQIKGHVNEKDFICSLKNEVASIYVNDKLVYGQEKLEEKLEDKYYFISPDSFFQVNKEQTIRLYGKVKEYLGTGNLEVLDLYCGMASIGIFVNETSKKIVGVELNDSSVKDARENILRNHLSNVVVKKGNVGSLLEVKNTYDAVIVDPPRSGLDKRTRDGLLQMNVEKIIYVSCNPITLARDIFDLEKKYEFKEITLFDLFPNTYHVESIVLLNRRKSL